MKETLLILLIIYALGVLINIIVFPMFIIFRIFTLNYFNLNTKLKKLDYIMCIGSYAPEKFSLTYNNGSIKEYFLTHLMLSIFLSWFITLFYCLFSIGLTWHYLTKPRDIKDALWKLKNMQLTDDEIIKNIAIVTGNSEEKLKSKLILKNYDLKNMEDKYNFSWKGKDEYDWLYHYYLNFKNNEFSITKFYDGTMHSIEGLLVFKDNNVVLNIKNEYCEHFGKLEWQSIKNGVVNVDDKKFVDTAEFTKEQMIKNYQKYLEIGLQLSDEVTEKIFKFQEISRLAVLAEWETD